MLNSHEAGHDFADLLSSWLRDARIPSDKRTRILLLGYLRILLNGNKNINLVGTACDREIIRKHFVDSLIASPLLPEAQGVEVADIGTGGGLPGIPLKIANPGVSMTLIESSGKKCGFLKDATASLSLSGTDVLHARAENCGRKPAMRGRFSFVVCRAVAHLAVISEYALPLLEKNGIFIAYKGPKAEQEIEESRGAVQVLGGSFSGIRNYVLPEKHEKRVLVLIRKTGETPPAYPRREGMPLKRPLENVPRGTFAGKKSATGLSASCKFRYPVNSSIVICKNHAWNMPLFLA